jgi:RimJ/RimL family protein N-acetyltransferase
VRIELPGCAIRPWRRGDRASLVKHADDREIWLQVRDRFPHPYTEHDADEFLARCEAADPATSFAIEVEGEAAGGIAFMLGSDVERISAEVGYWLGRRFWGRGIMSSVVRATRDVAIETYGLRRLFAIPYARNAASVKVLENAGFKLEGTLRCAALKDGELLDQLMYAYVVTDGE